MGRLITQNEAAERIGITRQTISNWVRKDLIPSVQIDRAILVDSDIIDELADNLRDIEQRKKVIERYQQKLKQVENTMRKELYISENIHTKVTRLEFYLSIPRTMYRLGILDKNECDIIQEIIQGYTLEEVADYYHITRERIRQIAYKAIRKSENLSHLNDLRDENERLKKELKSMRLWMDIQRQAMKTEIVDDEENERIWSLLCTDISELPISVRAKRAMGAKAIGANTLGEVVTHKTVDFLNIRHIGMRTLKEIEKFLNDNGLHFEYNVEGVLYRHNQKALNEG